MISSMAAGDGETTATLLLVDDHPLYHAGLGSVLQAAHPGYRLLGAADAAAGHALLMSDSTIDLILVDIVLPGTDGFDAVADYGRACPHVPRLLISGREDQATLVRASRSGASGFVAKSWPVERLLKVIERVLAGGSGFDARTDAQPASGGIGQQLTLRQIEVLCLLAEGKSNKEIAHRLDIADRTVRAHLTELFQALGVVSRVQAVLQAKQLGIVA